MLVRYVRGQTDGGGCSLGCQRRKKVVFLVPSLGMGGMERVLVNYANLFVKRGYDVTVLNFTFDDPGIVEKLSDNVHYYKSYSQYSVQ